ncbi:DUF2341 domain-containing protein [Thermococcus sp.]|uniref:DUF2341 domain-containing protein n=1 Tax=Thermococcus sp. TaxID=35749 RepID=UPI002620A1F8|nr:DUF2341 domain-containing protein [Thermococcus sp.]
MKKLRIITVLLILALLAITLGLAIPGINMRIQGIGEGSSPVYSPTGSGGFYFWVDGSGNIVNVTLSFANDLSAGTKVFVKLYNSSGGLIALWNRTLKQLLPALKEINVTPTSQVNVNEVYDIRVVLSSPDLISPPGKINLSVNKLGEGAWAGDLCNPVQVSNSQAVSLSNYTIRVVLNSSTQILWNYLNPTNVYFTTASGSPLYYWIQELDTNNRRGVIWVKVTSIPAEKNVTVCMHYGGVNPYTSYNNPEKVFLFFDDFSGTSVNQSKWNIHGNPTVSGGKLQLSGYYQVGNGIYGNPSWVWTKINLPTSYEVILNASISSPDLTISRNNPDTFIPGPFYTIYIDSSGVGYGETIEYYTYYYLGIIPITNTYDALTNRSVVTGRGTVLGYTGNPYSIGSWHIFEIYVNSNGTVHTYQDGSSMVRYTLPSSAVLRGPFALGQITGGNPSEYDWVAIRKHISPEPSVKVGHWYGSLKFRPQPPATLEKKSGLATILGILTSGSSDTLPVRALGPEALEVRSNPSHLAHGTNKPEEGVREITFIPVPIPEWP